MPCEMCGKERELVTAIVEGSILKVCGECSIHGNIIEVKKPKTQEIREKKVIETDETEEAIKDDFSEIIKEERGKRGLTQEQLAKLMAEKESVIQGIESGKPLSFKLAKKLEQFLRIQLIIPIEKKIKKEFSLKSKDITIGDLIRIKKGD